jgi:hypothetical protein
MEKNHPGKQKASRKILEALTANWHKHLASRRPPADKRRKVGKAENAHNESLPTLLESLHLVPKEKGICHRGTHNEKSPIRRCLSTILSDCDFALLPKLTCRTQRVQKVACDFRP